MKIVHVKSPCCKARVIRYGGKRRQCSACSTTFTIRPQRRGRRRVRHTQRYIQHIFQEGCKLKHLTHGTLSLAAVQKRFQRALPAFISQPRSMHIRGTCLALIIDARWHTFHKERFTMYFFAVKSSHRDTAVMFDPLLRKGKEAAHVWKELIGAVVSLAIKRRIVALVSDGLAGGKGIAATFGWKHQRCHFHLIKELAIRRGRRKHLSGWTTREQIYQDIRKLLCSKSPSKIRFLIHRLQRLSRHNDCPSKIRMIVNEVIGELPAFHLYLTHPEWNLPNTTCVMESLGNLVHAGVGKVRTPQALFNWATATIRAHPKFTC